ncbi:MAG: hypothetical protein AAGM40_24125 [Cyanobacteria bacterium J06573_2]
MNSNQNQPREFDVVLGGENPAPVTGVVLGGIEGVKRRLESEIVDVRIKALNDALGYGDNGLDLLIEALKNDSLQIKRFASRLLKECGGNRGKQALLEFDHNLYFTKIDNWSFQEIDSHLNNDRNIENAYIFTNICIGEQEEHIIDDAFQYLKYFKYYNIQEQENTLDNLTEILKDAKFDKIEAFQCKYARPTSEKIVANYLINAKERLKNIKALYVGDKHDYEYKTSNVILGNISNILEAYPYLEALQVRGFGYDLSYLSFTPLKHRFLKTLIIETGYMLESKIIDQICELELPELEYLELWLGYDEEYEPQYYEDRNPDDDFNSIKKSALNNLLPIIRGEAFPNLKYLGLRSCNYTNAIAELIVHSPLLDNLVFLDLSMGNLTDEGADYLLDSPKINQLHALNLSMNILSSEVVKELSNLKCQVITEMQNKDSSYRYHVLSDYQHHIVYE